MLYAVLPADPVEEHLALARSEAGGEHLAVVGEDLVGHPITAHSQSQSFTDRPGGGPRHKESGDAEAGVVIQAGDDHEVPACRELHPAHDVHLPEFHRATPFPTTIVLALAAPLLGIDEAVTDETAIDGRAAGKGIHPLAGEVVADGARTPERMSPPEIHDAGFDQRWHLMGTAVRPGRVVDETAQAVRRHNSSASGARSGESRHSGWRRR